MFGRLIVDSTAGQASFIVDSSDVGLAIVFVCQATNQAGTGPPSDPVVVTPTAR
jgi:hypothetical protein